MLLATIVVGVVKQTGITLALPIVNNRIEELYTEDLWPLKKKKAAYYTLGCIWYSISGVVGLLIFWNHPNVPRIFGGSGDMGKINQYFPEQAVIEYGKFYMIMQTGSHGYSVIYHLINGRESVNFWELLLHHFVTMILIFNVYFTNGLARGCVILMFHDWGDWAYNITNMMRDLFNSPKYLPYLLPFIPVFFFLFIYTRCVA